jgi:hypothetical protein
VTGNEIASVGGDRAVSPSSSKAKECVDEVRSVLSTGLNDVVDMCRISPLVDKMLEFRDKAIREGGNVETDTPSLLHCDGRRIIVESIVIQTILLMIG